MSQEKYIFIVGLSRSGTSLMRQILNKSTQIGLCNENHFLGHLIPMEGMRYKFKKFGDLKQDENIRRLVKYIYSPEFQHSSRFRRLSWQWKWFIKRINQNEMLEYILATDRSERSLFKLFMRLFAEHQGAVVMGEKTPAHLRYVPTLMEWFPQAQIIHMLRDPRAIYISEVRRRKEKPITPPYKQLYHIEWLFQLFMVLQVSLTWLDGIWRINRYQKKYPQNYHLVKFEDLVVNPEHQVQRLCLEIGVDFQVAMLEQMVVSRGFKEGKPGFDSKATIRWQAYIDSWVDYWFIFWFKKYLLKFGYPV